MAEIGEELICQKDAFLCAAYGTSLYIAFHRKLGAGFFGGEGFILQTLEGPKRFRIEDTTIVEISDKRLLQDTREQTVTLVTCYPFYFVGHAPKRFIVTASLDSTYVNQN